MLPQDIKTLAETTQFSEIRISILRLINHNFLLYIQQQMTGMLLFIE